MFKQTDELVKIGEIARKSNLPVSTIRHYLNLGLIEETFRTPGDVRIFSKAETLRQIESITCAAASKSLKEVAAAV